MTLPLATRRFHKINDILINDNRDALERGWMLFIRIATTFITRAPDTGEDHLIVRECTTYRGSKMTMAQVGRARLPFSLKVGKWGANVPPV